jgi:DNA-binding transcriptional LysR family regulator
MRQALRLSDGVQKAGMPANGRITVDDLETLREFVLRGGGIGTLPDFLCRPYAPDGTLVRVLPRWAVTTGALSFVYPSQPFVPAKVRTFIDLAIAQLRGDQGRRR